MSFCNPRMPRQTRPPIIAKPLLCAMLVGFTLMAHADECLQGSWKGQLGDTPIMLRFDATGPDATLAGRYYYRTSAQDLLLRRDAAAADRWDEIDPQGKVSGHWELRCNSDGQTERKLAGTWKSPNGARTQPLTARPQAHGAYRDARMAALQPTVAQRQSLGPWRHELLGAPPPYHDRVHGLRLLGTNAGLPAINRALWSRYLDDLDTAMECIISGRLERGEEHGYEYTAAFSPIARNGAFIVIRHNSGGYCGGAHPFAEQNVTTYDAVTGASEDVSSWLDIPYRREIDLSSMLGKRLLALYGAPANDICPTVMTFSGSTAWPTPEGLVFRAWAPYAYGHCIEDVVVPYRDIAPRLSPYGQGQVRRFRQTGGPSPS